MANLVSWEFTQLPTDVIDIFKEIYFLTMGFDKSIYPSMQKPMIFIA